MPETQPLVTPLPVPEGTRQLRGPPLLPPGEPTHKVVYLVYDESLKDGRVGLGVFSTLERARRACRAHGGAPLVSIRPALLDGAVAFAQDYV